jgi:hypothetical protein
LATHIISENHDPLLSRIKSFAKWVALLSLFLLIVTTFGKDDLPPRERFQFNFLDAPQQYETDLHPFVVEANGETYTITPRNTYRLEGVVVSYHDADALSDIWHHEKWKDYLNIRDLCVIWGENIESEVYRKMSFENDSWTCWAYWPDAETGSRFSMNQLSNNHLLTEDPELISRLISAEPGDHIRLYGLLAKYENRANGFQRDTSTTRTDTGNGACETIYLKEFEILQKANIQKRALHRLAKWLLITSSLFFIALFFVTPVRRFVS